MSFNTAWACFLLENDPWPCHLTRPGRVSCCPGTKDFSATKDFQQFFSLFSIFFLQLSLILYNTTKRTALPELNENKLKMKAKIPN